MGDEEGEDDCEDDIELDDDSPNSLGFNFWKNDPPNKSACDADKWRRMVTIYMQWENEHIIDWAHGYGNGYLPVALTKIEQVT